MNSSDLIKMRVFISCLTLFIYFSSVPCGYGVGHNRNLYGRRYSPLWSEGAQNAFTRNFGQSSIRHMIENAGLLYENYSVTTEDGYVLNLNRLVHPVFARRDSKGYPLLLINGFNMGAEMWLIQREMDTNLAAVWSALEYDVWIGDQRGTIRSRRHISYNSSTDKEFWNHSTDEIGVYDYSAFIDFILHQTGRPNLVVMCISMGCSFHVALIDARPKYNEKILGAFYFNPLVNNIRRAKTMSLVTRLILYLSDVIARAYEETGNFLFPKLLTRMRKELYHLCLPIYRIILSAKADCFSVLAWAGTSLKTHRHLLQMYYRGRFSKFDYGREINSRVYGTTNPPLYDLKKITSFVALYHSDSDEYYSIEGGRRTLKSLGGPTYECVMPNFAHSDVAMGPKFKYIFPDVIQVLDSLVGYAKDNHTKAMSGKCPSMEWVRDLRM